MSLLSLKKLTVKFGGLTAVQDVDAAVEQGQIFSIIGPNGAGKTTVFNAITGIYEPTSGSIEFHNRPLERAFTPRVAVGFLLVGLLTGIIAALVALDVNALWRATIKRNYAGPGSSFSYRAAWDDAINYWNGRLALEPMRGNRWAIRTADARNTLGYGNTQAEAEATAARLEKMISAASATGRAADKVLVQRDGKWVVRDLEDTENLAEFDTEADARLVLDKYAAIEHQSAARRRNSVWAMLIGFIFGTAGMWTVWNRARRTPEVISKCGIARTFQNIRLFQNMSTLDNVLVGLDRTLKGGVIRMALQLPAMRAAERGAQAKAREFLDFVGLAGKEKQIAKSLPYGDQRRLEIARALATGPELILLDEPAAGMNPSESLDLNSLIERIRARGLSVMLIEHHMKVVMGISDRIAVLDYGIKIAEGTPEEVRANPKVIAAYLGSEEVS